MSTQPILPTQRDWILYMLPRIEWRGRKFHNLGTLINPDRMYVEDWVSGERIFIDLNCPANERPIINIPPDRRWMYYGNRNPSETMLPEYLAIGADKWDDRKSCDRAIKELFPNRPSPITSNFAAT